MATHESESYSLQRICWKSTRSIILLSADNTFALICHGILWGDNCAWSTANYLCVHSFVNVLAHLQSCASHHRDVLQQERIQGLAGESLQRIHDDGSHFFRLVDICLYNTMHQLKTLVWLWWFTFSLASQQGWGSVFFPSCLIMEYSLYRYIYFKWGIRLRNIWTVHGLPLRALDDIVHRIGVHTSSHSFDQSSRDEKGNNFRSCLITFFCSIIGRVLRCSMNMSS